MCVCIGGFVCFWLIFDIQLIDVVLFVLFALTFFHFPNDSPVTESIKRIKSGIESESAPLFLYWAYITPSHSTSFLCSWCVIFTTLTARFDFLYRTPNFFISNALSFDIFNISLDKLQIRVHFEQEKEWIILTLKRNK